MNNYAIYLMVSFPMILSDQSRSRHFSTLNKCIGDDIKKPPGLSSLKSPYRSSIETVALKCLVFEKIAFPCTHFGNR